jgi:hypothetical protein
METAADVGASAPASESFVPEIIETNTPEAAAPSLEEDLRSIWDKRNPPRENGRFAPKNPTEQPAIEAEAPVTEVAVQTAETTQEQAKPAIDAPISWTAEQKAKFASLPPDTQAYIAQRDKESHEAITRAGQQIKAFEPIREVIEQHADTFQRNGLQPHEGFARLLAVEKMLEQDPASAIREIAKAYGVNLQGMNDEQNATPENQRIAELEARLARQESHLTAQMRQKQEAESNALAREIADFAKDKPHFESVRKVMAGLMSSGAAETMQDAYDRAIYADPTIRQSLQVEAQKAAEDKRKAEEAERVSKAKKAAGVNVKGSPANAAAARTMEQDLRAIWTKNHGS